MLIKDILQTPNHRSSISNYEEVNSLFLKKDFPSKKDDLWRYFNFKILEKELSYLDLSDKKTFFEFNHEIETISFGTSPFITKDKFELFSLLNSKEDKLLMAQDDIDIVYKIKNNFSTNMLKIIIPMKTNITINLNITNEIQNYFNIHNITLKVFGNLNINIISDLNNGYSLSYLNFILSDHAKVNINIIGAGNLFNKTIINTTQFKNSECYLKYRSILKKSENTDLVVLSQINKPNCILDHDIKTVLFDESIFSCYGVIDIMKNGSGTIANHKQSTIAMSEGVQINAIPVLKIDNGDVKCSHGAPSYYLTESDRFYIMSRGISKKDADKIILKSFLNLYDTNLNNNICSLLENSYVY